MKRKETLILCIWFGLFTGVEALSCTIFYVARDGLILAGNNEDWKDPNTKLWIYPAQQTNHGWIKFGYASGFPQGGMNDQGLFWDATAGPYKEMPYSESNKTLYSGVLMQKVIEKSSNVDEAKAILQDFYCQDQYKAQYLIGDAQGTSMIAEGDSFLMKQINYQVLTNFYQSDPDLGGYPCWRYETATELLEDCDSISPYYIGKVLASTCQEGNYPTQYSNIYDLKNRRVYLFYYHNYEEFLIINLLDEMKNGEQSYNIPTLFSQLSHLTPDNGDAISGDEAIITWKGLPGCSYRIIYATNPQLSNPGYVDVDYISEYQKKNSSMSVLLPLFLLLLLFPGKRKLVGITLLFIVMTSGIQCENNEELADQENVVEHSSVITSLEPGTTYFWRIEAINNESAPFTTITGVHNFRTKTW